MGEGCSKTDFTKEERIAAEKAKYAEILANLDANKLTVVTPLVDRAAFITVSLQDLEEELNYKGWTETYQNGENQFGVKKAAAADVHLSLTKNLTAITKQLIDITPAASKKSKLKELCEK